MKTGNYLKVLTILLFLAMLAAGLCLTSAVAPKEYSDTENRILEAKPELNMEDILEGEYQAAKERYLSDQILFRDSFVSLAAGMDRAVGKKDINGVYIGRDGYLLEKYGEEDFEKGQIKDNVRQLTGFLNELTELYGRERVSCMMIPSKTYAMSEKLPEFAAVYDEGKIVQRIRKGLEHPEILFDAGEALHRHKDEYIYYRTDHHWTTLGAYYAYEMWTKSNPADYEREIIFDDFYGTTYNKVHVAVPKDEVEVFHHEAQAAVTVNMNDGELVSDSIYFPKEGKKGFNRYDVFLSGNTFQIVIDRNTDDDDKGTLLLIKDSFANCFVPFLLGDYKRIIMIDYRYGKKNVGKLLDKYPEITDVLVMYNVVKFAKDKNLRYLNTGDKKKNSMEEFDADEFFSDL